jgi:hypothetical protein
MGAGFCSAKVACVEGRRKIDSTKTEAAFENLWDMRIAIVLCVE